MTCMFVLLLFVPGSDQEQRGGGINKAARQPVSVGFISDYTPHKLGEAGASTRTIVLDLILMVISKSQLINGV